MNLCVYLHTSLYLIEKLIRLKSLENKISHLSSNIKIVSIFFKEVFYFLLQILISYYMWLDWMVPTRKGLSISKWLCLKSNQVNVLFTVQLQKSVLRYFFFVKYIALQIDHTYRYYVFGKY